MDWAPIAFSVGAFVLGCLLGEAGSPANTSEGILTDPYQCDKDQVIPIEEILHDAMFDIVYTAGELNACPRCSEQLHVEGHEIVESGGLAIVNLALHCPTCDEPLYWPVSGEVASAVLAKQLFDQVTIAQDVIDLEKPGTLEL